MASAVDAGSPHIQNRSARWYHWQVDEKINGKEQRRLTFAPILHIPHKQNATLSKLFG
jgi:hypothetical protein